MPGGAGPPLTLSRACRSSSLRRPAARAFARPVWRKRAANSYFSCETWQRGLFGPRPVPEVFKREFPISLALRPKQLRAAAEESAFLIPAAAQLQSQYAGIKCPVRLFHGDEDHFIECEQSRHLHQVLPRSVLHFVQNAGHMVHYADPRIISQTVEAIARA